jgi:hypothetical protein
MVSKTLYSGLAGILLSVTLAGCAQKNSVFEGELVHPVTGVKTQYSLERSCREILSQKVACSEVLTEYGPAGEPVHRYIDTTGDGKANNLEAILPDFTRIIETDGEKVRKVILDFNGTKQVFDKSVPVSTDIMKKAQQEYNEGRRYEQKVREAMSRQIRRTYFP